MPRARTLSSRAKTRVRSRGERQLSHQARRQQPAPLTGPATDALERRLTPFRKARRGPGVKFYSNLNRRAPTKKNSADSPSNTAMGVSTPSSPTPRCRMSSIPIRAQ